MVAHLRTCEPPAIGAVDMSMSMRVNTFK